MGFQESAEAIVGDADRRRRAECEVGLLSCLSMTKETQISMAQMPDSMPEGSGRKPRGYGDGASSVTAGHEVTAGGTNRGANTAGRNTGCAGTQ